MNKDIDVCTMAENLIDKLSKDNRELCKKNKFITVKPKHWWDYFNINENRKRRILQKMLNMDWYEHYEERFNKMSDEIADKILW
jgi:hypothetical protein